MNNINAILYEELRGYLKEENERIENDLFKAVLSACRLVNAGQGLTSSCSLAGISSVATHYEGIVLRPYVKAVMKKAEPRIEKTLKNIEEYRNRKERFENIEVDLKENSKQSDDEFMEEYNLLIHLEAFYSYSKKDKTKFQIPYNRLRLSKKYFNSEKKMEF